MSAVEHISEKQFKHYRPAQEEGKPVADWLSTKQGHRWQSTTFDQGGTSGGVQAMSSRNAEYYHPMFSVRDTTESRSGETKWPEPYDVYNLDNPERHPRSS